MSDHGQTEKPRSGFVDRLVRLCLCARPSCKHIYPEDEADFYAHSKGDGWKEHRCPKCRHKNYWAINAAMERVKLSEWEPSPWPLPPVANKCKNPRCETTMSEGSPDYCPQCQDDREKLRARMGDVIARLEAGEDILPNTDISGREAAQPKEKNAE